MREHAAKLPNPCTLLCALDIQQVSTAKPHLSSGGWGSVKEAQFSSVVGWAPSELDLSHTAAPVSAATGGGAAVGTEEGSEGLSAQLGPRKEQACIRSQI